MFTIIKLVQWLVRALNSDGTPGQVAAGIALGSVFGLTPLVNLHNLVMLAAIVLLRVSIPGALIGWVASVPLGFLLDPVFDRLGMALLGWPPLRGPWSTLYNTPVVSLADLNNSVVLGSLVGWAILAGPLFLLARWGVARYRATLYRRVRQMKAVQLVQASKIYNVYRLFRP